MQLSEDLLTIPLPEWQKDIPLLTGIGHNGYPLLDYSDCFDIPDKADLSKVPDWALPNDQGANYLYRGYRPYSDDFYAKRAREWGEEQMSQSYLDRLPEISRALTSQLDALRTIFTTMAEIKEIIKHPSVVPNEPELV